MCFERNFCFLLFENATPVSRTRLIQNPQKEEKATFLRSTKSYKEKKGNSCYDDLNISCVVVIYYKQKLCELQAWCSPTRCRKIIHLANLFLKNLVEFASLNTGYRLGQRKNSSESDGPINDLDPQHGIRLVSATK